MSSNCKINLPPYVRVKDAARVMGRLFGLETERAEEDGKERAVVKGIRYDEDRPSYTNLYFDGVQVGGQNRRFVMFFYEDSPDGWRLMNPGTATLWQVAARRMVCIFGGSVDYDDCDNDEGPDLVVPIDPVLQRRDAESSAKLERLILELQPITQDDIDSFWESEANLPAPLTSEALEPMPQLEPTFGLTA